MDIFEDNIFFRPPKIMNRVDYRSPARLRMASRMKQAVVLFVAVIVGILASVTVNF